MNNSKYSHIKLPTDRKTRGNVSYLSDNTEWAPREGFKTAGPDEELLQHPASHILVAVAVDGVGEVFADGLKLEPVKRYADADVYELISIAQSMGGNAPGILSLKVSEGTRYRFRVTSSLGAFLPWIP